MKFISFLVFAGLHLNYQATCYFTGLKEFQLNAAFQLSCKRRVCTSVLKDCSNIFGATPPPNKRCRSASGIRTGALRLGMAEYMFGMEGISIQPGDRAFIVGADIKKDK